MRKSNKAAGKTIEQRIDALESSRKPDMAIAVALIGVLGTVIGAVIALNASRETNKLTERVEADKSALTTRIEAEKNALTDRIEGRKSQLEQQRLDADNQMALLNARVQLGSKSADTMQSKFDKYTMPLIAELQSAIANVDEGFDEACTFPQKAISKDTIHSLAKLMELRDKSAQELGDIEHDALVKYNNFVGQHCADLLRRNEKERSELYQQSASLRAALSDALRKRIQDETDRIHGALKVDGTPTLAPTK